MWLHGLAGNSQIAYRRDVSLFRDFLGKALLEARLQDLQAFVVTLQELAPASQRRRIAAVKSLFHFAHLRIGYLPVNVAGALRVPKVPSGLSQRIIPEAAIYQMLAHEKDARNRALLRYLYATGCRVSEVWALRWQQIVPRVKGAQVTIVGKGTKERVVLIPAKVYEELLALGGRAVPERAVFLSRKGNPLSVRRIQAIVVAAAARAGIRGNVSPHWLRHAHASHSLDRGCPISLVQQTLGHASIETTGRYLHARPGDSSGLYLPL